MGITAVIIARNEEAKIRRCLESVRFCDEIVVVDSGSTDRTAEVAREYTPHVFLEPWRGFVGQRNFALSRATQDWVLSIDADEEVSPELREEILATISSETSAVAFSIPRRTIHMGRWIRHGGWYPNRLVRLFQRTRGTWMGGDVHEYWQPSGPLGRLESDLIHYSFDDLSDQVSRNNYYSTLGALSLRKTGARPGLGKLLTKPLSKFLETYVVKRGFLDGFPGLIISVSAAYSVFLKWAKLWELEHGHGDT